MQQTKTVASLTKRPVKHYCVKKNKSLKIGNNIQTIVDINFILSYCGLTASFKVRKWGTAL